MKIAEAEEEEKKRKEIQMAKQASAKFFRWEKARLSCSCH